ncbi:unnamed protein product [Vitrella brassicaformis CCMP3155]|uniref:Uncharacterized protein n=1 Tax=Vitrella brassicaformis (strain CCMP3155) TaxID=1169540 RepID=A0A0G4H3S3_VITBC|nr:unnamed protein product [Vitrella brassicaformis CCMP3155]|mmetsp:Transcript_31062/g.76994  ORF Transcript_31062/g.76994 Transcript_31062/m.76994 type:complete len:134 (+) Transcript_31062:75-476(+)|eukprot:CEM38157.1 unnamed protein product [Vitrella brassicaformis CCMP3155]
MGNTFAPPDDSARIGLFAVVFGPTKCVYIDDHACNESAEFTSTMMDRHAPAACTKGWRPGSIGWCYEKWWDVPDKARLYTHFDPKAVKRACAWQDRWTLERRIGVAVGTGIALIGVAAMWAKPKWIKRWVKLV